MAAYVNSNGNNGVNSSTSTPMPTGIAAGDLLITDCYVNSDVSASIAVTAGWTLFGLAHNAGFTIAKAYRVATGSDSNPGWSWTGAFQFSSNVFHYNGTIYTTAPIGAHSEVVGNGTSAQGTALTLTAANSFVAFDVNTRATSQTIPLLSGWTSDSNFSSANGSERLSHQIFTSAGSSSGNPAATITTDDWGYTLTEIRTQAPPATESGTIAQTLKLVTQSATGQQWTKGAIVQTLKLVTQSSAGWAEAIGSAAQTLFKIAQLASGTTGQVFTGTIAQRLNLVTQSSAGWVEAIGAAAQTLFRVNQAVVGQQWTKGAIVQTLKLVTQQATGGLAGFVGHIAQRLSLVTQSSTGWAEAIGPIVQVLKPITQTVGGWAEIIGDAAQMLPLIQQLINANEVTLETLFFATTRQLNDYVGRIEKQIRSTWHGPPDDPLPPVQ